MRIRNLALDIDDTRSPTKDDENSDFQFRNRSLCNFLSRESGAKKFVTDGFNLVLVRGVERPGDSPWKATVYKSDVTQTLVSEVPHRLQRYRKLPLNPLEQNEFFIEMIEEGLIEAAKKFSIPLQSYQDAIKEFRNGGYKNEWVLRKKSMPEHKIRLQLTASLTIFDCKLTLKGFKGKKQVASAHVATTPSDELFFLRYCRDIILRNDQIVFTDWIFGDKKDVWSTDIDRFLASEE